MVCEGIGRAGAAGAASLLQLSDLSEARQPSAFKYEEH